MARQKTHTKETPLHLKDSTVSLSRRTITEKSNISKGETTSHAERPQQFRRRSFLRFLAAGGSLTALSGTTTAMTEQSETDQADRPVTVMFGLVQPEEMSHYEFVSYFRNTHIPLVKQVLKEEETSPLAHRSIVAVSPTESPFSGIEELTFPNLETYQQLATTDSWQRAVAGVINFTDPQQNVVVVGMEQKHLASNP